jgi:hypothetical protein
VTRSAPLRKTFPATSITTRSVEGRLRSDHHGKSPPPLSSTTRGLPPAVPLEEPPTATGGLGGTGVSCPTGLGAVAKAPAAPPKLYAGGDVSEHPLGATFAGLLLFIIVSVESPAASIRSMSRAPASSRWSSAEGHGSSTFSNARRWMVPCSRPLIVFQTESGTRVSFNRPGGLTRPSNTQSATKSWCCNPPERPESAENSNHARAAHDPTRFWRSWCDAPHRAWRYCGVAGEPVTPRSHCVALDSTLGSPTED